MPGLRKGNGKLTTASGMDMPMRGGSFMQVGPTDDYGSSAGSSATPKTAKKQRSSGNGGGKPTMNKNMAGKGKEQADVESKQKKGYSSKAKQSGGSHSPGAKGQTKTAKKEKNFSTETYF